MIRIRSLREGFRRGGVAHSTTPTDHPDTQFTATELEQLLLEPMLVVEVLADDAGELSVQDRRQAIADFLDDAGQSDEADESDESGEANEAGEASESGDAGKSEGTGESGDTGKSEGTGESGETDSSAKSDKPARKSAK